jgi:hypothetical protein
MSDINQRPTALSPGEGSIVEEVRSDDLFAKRKQLTLERAKLTAEIRLKKLELALKKKEFHRWRNPTVLAILALAGSVTAALVQQHNALALERTKAQSNLILEAIKTGNTDTASSNLEFLIDIGVLDDPDHKIKDNLAKKHGPVLPSGVSEVFPPTDMIRVADNETWKGISDVHVRIHGTSKECPVTNSAGDTHCPAESGDHFDLTRTGYEDQIDVPASSVFLLKPIHRDK